MCKLPPRSHAQKKSRYAPVAQWIRVFGFEPKSRKFESCRVYQSKKPRLTRLFTLVHTTYKQQC